MKKIYIVRIVLIVLIGFWMGTIFGFSAENGESSQSLSDKITVKVVKYIEPEYDSKDLLKQQDIFNKTSFFVRKTGHFGEYAILGILITMFAMTFRAYRSKKIRYRLMTIVVPFIYACTDEFHQLFVPGRSGEFTDVCLDTVGATFGILLVMIIVWIVEKIKNRNSNKPKQLAEKNEETGLKRKVMFIASTGGHLNELMQIKPLFKKFDYHIVTEKTKVDDSFKEEYKDKISFLIYGTKKYPFIYIFKFIANCFISLYYFFRYQPEVVVTTGTHTAVPMCYIAKLFGSKVIFIETFANRTSGTVAGRLVYPIADTFVVQWEEMHKVYPKSVCWGWIY